jgi:tetratricopeptide (TPR) repeat protein
MDRIRAEQFQAEQSHAEQSHAEQANADLAPVKSTIVTASNPNELSPIEAAIMDACNALHEARERADVEAIAAYTDALPRLLARYDATDGDNHPNPAWSRPNQRALALSAMDRVEDAVRTELIALKYADTPRRREISLGNLADRCLRLNDAQLAVGYFLEAIEANPRSVPVLVTGASALFRAGHRDEADAIFRAMHATPGLLAEGSELTAYLAFDPATRAMRNRLPALDDLYAAWELRPSQADRTPERGRP